MPKRKRHQRKYMPYITFFVLVGIVIVISVFASSSNEVSPTYKNFYGINWRGTACDNVAYAKSMGYDYVFYLEGMENCEDATDMHFYLENPEQKMMGNYWQVDLSKQYTDAQKKEINNLMVWKSNDPFPKNIATGWFFSSTSFRPLLDFQRQSVIDATVNKVLTYAKSKENKENNFLFGGYSWDVPDLAGDLWTSKQSEGGKIVALSYWNPNKIDSGIVHDNLALQYPTYSDGHAAFYKALYEKTALEFSDFGIIYEPYSVYSGWINKIKDRSDFKDLMPGNVILCQENGDGMPKNVDFITDSRIFESGIITKDRMCSTTPDTHDATRNLEIAGYAAKDGAWFSWFGRFGGSKDDSTGVTSTSYNSINDVPARLKLIRVVPGWDNMNSVPLNSRSWNAEKQVYKSSLSYADKNIIYSTHPDNKYVYVVYLNAAGYVDLGNKEVTDIMSTDSVFRPVSSVKSQFKEESGKLYLSSDSGLNKGYIIVTG